MALQDRAGQSWLVCTLQQVQLLFLHTQTADFHSCSLHSQTPVAAINGNSFAIMSACILYSLFSSELNDRLCLLVTLDSLHGNCRLIERNRLFRLRSEETEGNQTDGDAD